MSGSNFEPLWWPLYAMAVAMTTFTIAMNPVVGALLALLLLGQWYWRMAKGHGSKRSLPDRRPDPRRYRPAAGFPSNQRCPFCRSSLDVNAYACIACQTTFHAACLHEARGCTTLGCAHAPDRRVRA